MEDVTCLNTFFIINIVISRVVKYHFIAIQSFLPITCFYFSLQLTEEILLADQLTATSCYSPEARRRGRKHRTEPSQYNYSRRQSWSSTENSLEIHRHREHSVNSIHTSREIINLANVRAPLESTANSRPPILNVNTHAISNLTTQAREMAGGQPDYV